MQNITAQSGNNRALQHIIRDSTTFPASAPSMKSTGAYQQSHKFGQHLQQNLNSFQRQFQRPAKTPGAFAGHFHLRCKKILIATAYQQPQQTELTILHGTTKRSLQPFQQQPLDAEHLSTIRKQPCFTTHHNGFFNFSSFCSLNAVDRSISAEPQIWPTSVAKP
ncbi:hypothetical protein Nepgr_018735 [Nepenthes gracilis]|uniref:Uncharacterized protein n=1 Tax=Nepenthes gracilis TaxID=150966 RepID=A0AAD3SUE5_NEPGR|nr:hypothetical protein Nepgr_018735 [Nepenthes gracilis]